MFIINPSLKETDSFRTELKLRSLPPPPFPFPKQKLYLTWISLQASYDHAEPTY